MADRSGGDCAGTAAARYEPARTDRAAMPAIIHIQPSFQGDLRVPDAQCRLQEAVRPVATLRVMTAAFSRCRAVRSSAR
jgi:hypothetical protein